jgi:hypothetical protein
MDTLRISWRLVCYRKKEIFMDLGRERKMGNGKILEFRESGEEEGDVWAAFFFACVCVCMCA